MSPNAQTKTVTNRSIFENLTQNSYFNGGSHLNLNIPLNIRLYFTFQIMYVEYCYIILNECSFETVFAEDL